MNIAVIGHGPSLIGGGNGDYIDSFDVVVRMKNCGKTLGTEDYGNKIDALCLSTEVLGLVDKVTAGMFWLYPKNGKYDEAQAFEVIAKKGAPFMIPLDLMNYWNAHFQSMGSKHPCVSTGMASIIIAAHYHEPEKITLGGFDTLLDPSKPFTRNDIIPRTGIGEINHDWKTENDLLKIVADTYKLTIAIL
jgi:hypothetical protein